MAYQDSYRLSCHAVISNLYGEILLLKATYGELSWGLPGGAIDPNETIHEALKRECMEELACKVSIDYLSGVYYHRAFNSQVFIFRCQLPRKAEIVLSDEHSEFRYTSQSELSPIQAKRVSDCLGFDGVVKSAKF